MLVRRGRAESPLLAHLPSSVQPVQSVLLCTSSQLAGWRAGGLAGGRPDNNWLLAAYIIHTYLDT